MTLPADRSYIEKKQVIGGKRGCDRDTIHSFKRRCTNKMILKLIFYVPYDALKAPKDVFPHNTGTALVILHERLLC